MSQAYNKFVEILDGKTWEFSAPCRVDMGGTLDIKTFHTPLRQFGPATVNFAVNLRTYVRIKAYQPDRVKITSHGIGEAEYALAEAPFKHPLGLMMAVMTTLGAGGLEVEIKSTSPPRSSLGGSSVAAVALIKALSFLRSSALGEPELTPFDIAFLAHNVEEGVARIPCGAQDQLAAAYGGVNMWVWGLNNDACGYAGMHLAKDEGIEKLQDCFALAYCGNPHDSSDINNRWVNSFLAGEHRQKWIDTIALTHQFGQGVKAFDIPTMIAAMNKEAALRYEMTPAVLDEAGKELNEAALNLGAGCRFTGAGGGGCIWAVGEPEKIAELKQVWGAITAKHEGAKVLNAKIDAEGAKFERIVT